MGLLNPWWLLLGGAIAVPLIIHLLQRHQGPRVIFPAVRYLKRAEREHARRIKLRQLLLLLLRIFVLLVIAFAAARPFIRGAGSGHAPTAVVIVLDNSLSSGLVTGDRRVLDELKDRALETLTRAGPDDRFWLLRAGAPWEPALPGTAAAISQRVRETQPTAGRADLIAAVERARGILAQGADGRATEIQLLSDLQNSNLRGTLNGDDDIAIVVWSPKRATQANASVAAITVGGGLTPRAGERSSVVAHIGGSSRDSVNVRMSLEGRIAGAAIATPGSAAAIPLPARNASLVTGDVQIDADALRADDERHFVAIVAPPPTVTLTRSTPFVAQALDVLAGARRIARASSANADVVIAPAGVGAESAGGTGSVVFIAPESPLELPAVNRRLAALGINWQMEQAPPADLKFPVAVGGDELLRGLANVRVMTRYQLRPTGGATRDSVMLRLDDGSAWALRGTRARGGGFVLIASPLTVDATTLPASALMIPLLDRLTGSWSATEAPRSEAAPGERVTLPRDADLVIGPDGVRHEVAGSATFNEATEPGVYRVVAGDKMIGAFVVNAARAESDLEYADGRKIERALNALDVKLADDAGAWSKNTYDSRVGQEFWRALLLMLLALLIMEAIAAATGTTK